MKTTAILLLCSFLSLALPTLGQQCGWKGCPEGLCCSKWGWCGNTDDYCSPENCASNCPVPPSENTDIGHVISKQIFDRMMLLYGDAGRQNTGGARVNAYEAFITAAKYFPKFGNVGIIQTRRREVATFLAQTLRRIGGNDLKTENDAINYFKTAIRFWTIPQSSKPSPHQVMTIHGNSTLAADTTEFERLISVYYA